MNALNGININTFIRVIWGEEQAPIPALVTEVRGDSFKAVIFPNLHNGEREPVGPFTFFLSDLDHA